MANKFPNRESRILDVHPIAYSWLQVTNYVFTIDLENGEVIVGKAIKNDNEASSEYS